MKGALPVTNTVNNTGKPPSDRNHQIASTENQLLSGIRVIHSLYKKHHGLKQATLISLANLVGFIVAQRDHLITVF